MPNWFEIKTAKGMLSKAKREFERIFSATKLEDQLDHAMNCAVTLWSIQDWLWKEAEAKLKAKTGITDYSSYRAWLKKQPEAPSLLDCRDLANGSKHMRIDQYTPEVGSVPVSAANPTRTTNQDGSPRIILHDSYVLKVVYADGRREDAMPLLKAAISGWDQLMAREGVP